MNFKKNQSKSSILLFLSRRVTIFMVSLSVYCFSASTHGHNQNILIIGGSSGIGKALVAAYSESNYNVYTTFNNTNPDKTHKNVAYLNINLIDPKSIQTLSEAFKGVKFDIIIYNAGKFGYQSNKGPILDRQDWIDSFVINAIAPIEVAFALEKQFIEKGGKYVVITSRRGSNETNIKDQYEGRYSYRSSKSAANSALVALAMDLKKRGVTVLMLHPGQVKTEMTEYKGMEPNESAALIQKTISLMSLVDTGKFIDVQNNREMPW